MRLLGKNWLDDGIDGPTLRRRIIYTVLLVLLFRVLADIPVLNVDEERLNRLLADNPLTGVVDLFAGGEVLTHFSVVGAGIFPYLLALVLVNGATWLVPALRELRRRGEEGKKRLELYATLLTIPLAFVFAWSISHYLARQTGLFPSGIHWFTSASARSRSPMRLISASPRASAALLEWTE
jgi:preprotein translocase subunit SecY